MRLTRLFRSIRYSTWLMRACKGSQTMFTTMRRQFGRTFTGAKRLNPAPYLACLSVRPHGRDRRQLKKSAISPLRSIQGIRGGITRRVNRLMNDDLETGGEAGELPSDPYADFWDKASERHNTWLAAYPAHRRSDSGSACDVYRILAA